MKRLSLSHTWGNLIHGDGDQVPEPRLLNAAAAGDGMSSTHVNHRVCRGNATLILVFLLPLADVGTFLSPENRFTVNQTYTHIHRKMITQMVHGMREAHQAQYTAMFMWAHQQLQSGEPTSKGKKTASGKQRNDWIRRSCCKTRKVNNLFFSSLMSRRVERTGKTTGYWKIFLA